MEWLNEIKRKRAHPIPVLYIIQLYGHLNALYTNWIISIAMLDTVYHAIDNVICINVIWKLIICKYLICLFIKKDIIASTRLKTEILILLLIQ